MSNNNNDDDDDVVHNDSIDVPIINDDDDNDSVLSIDVEDEVSSLPTVKHTSTSITTTSSGDVELDVIQPPPPPPPDLSIVRAKTTTFLRDVDKKTAKPGLKHKRKTLRKGSKIVLYEDGKATTETASLYAEFRAREPKIRWSSYDTVASRLFSEYVASTFVMLMSKYKIFWSVSYILGALSLVVSMLVSGTAAITLGSIGLIAAPAVTLQFFLLNLPILRRIYVTSFEAWYMLLVTFAHIIMLFTLLPLDIRVFVIAYMSLSSQLTTYCRDAMLNATKPIVTRVQNGMLSLGMCINIFYCFAIIYGFIPDLTVESYTAGDIITNNVEIDVHLTVILVIFSLKIGYKTTKHPGTCANLLGKVGFVPVEPLQGGRRATLSALEKKNHHEQREKSYSSSVRFPSVASRTSTTVEMFDPHERKLVPQSYSRMFAWKYTVCAKVFKNSRLADMLWFTLKYHTILWRLMWFGGIVCGWLALFKDSHTFACLSCIAIPYPIMYVLNTNATIMREVLRQFQVWYLLFMLVLVVIALMDFFRYDERSIVCIMIASSLSGVILGFLHKIRSGIAHVFFVGFVIIVVVSLMVMMIAVSVGWFVNTRRAKIQYFNVQFNNVELVVSCLINIILFLGSSIFNLIVSPHYFVIIRARLSVVEVHPRGRKAARSNIPTGRRFRHSTQSSTTTTKTTPPRPFRHVMSESSIIK